VGGCVCGVGYGLGCVTVVNVCLGKEDMQGIKYQVQRVLLVVLHLKRLLTALGSTFLIAGSSLQALANLLLATTHHRMGQQAGVQGCRAALTLTLLPKGGLAAASCAANLAMPDASTAYTSAAPACAHISRAE
jgi:hypothetical protein